jgi:putative intracellular protease/amidase
MRVLFIISGSDTAFWLSEVTHPYWRLTERGVDVDFASPRGGKVVYDPFPANDSGSSTARRDHADDVSRLHWPGVDSPFLRAANRHLDVGWPA